MRLINDFCADVQCVLRKNHVSKMLTVLNDQQCAGWEKWLQFELIRHYHDHDHEPYWECGYDKNLQHKPENLTNRLDLVYRKKNTNTEYYNGVEIKVLRQPQYSIKGILKDLSSVAQIKMSHWELRAVTGLSIYSSDVMENISDNSKYKNFVSSLLSGRRAKVINCNGWDCLVFGWESKAISSPKVMKMEYRDYLQSIGEVAKKWDIDIE